MRLLQVLFVWLLASSPAGGQEADQLLSDSILSLGQVEQELLNLNNETLKLRELLTVSQGDSTQLKASLTAYQNQVELLSKNYDQLWQTSENYRKSSDLKNWVIGGSFLIGLVGGLILGLQK